MSHWLQINEDGRRELSKDIIQSCQVLATHKRWTVLFDFSEANKDVEKHLLHPLMLTPVHVLDTVVCKPKRVTTEVQVPHYEGRNMVGRKKSGLKLLECRQADCRSLDMHMQLSSNNKNVAMILPSVSSTAKDTRELVVRVSCIEVQSPPGLREVPNECQHICE